VVYLAVMPPPRNPFRDEALAQGLPRYTDGEACTHGHRGERYTANSACVTCDALDQAKRKPELYDYKAEHKLCTHGLSHDKPRKGYRLCDDCLVKKLAGRARTYLNRAIGGICPNGLDHAKPTEKHIYCDACLEQMRKAAAETRADSPPRECRNNRRHEAPIGLRRTCEACREKASLAGRVKAGLCVRGGAKHKRPLIVNGVRKKSCEACIAREVGRQKRAKKAVA
jgi:hypothetical protein